MQKYEVSFGIVHSLNSTAVNGDVFIKNLQGGTFAFEHLYSQILDSHNLMRFFVVDIA
jgi:hypothetical protein